MSAARLSDKDIAEIRALLYGGPPIALAPEYRRAARCLLTELDWTRLDLAVAKRGVRVELKGAP